MAASSTARIWFVYLLECRGGRLYTGITVDVARRFAQHVNGKGARYTRA
ncbi:MAG: GIY-YIG nuclease family protein, partial [Xanthomonadaceae bacterium]|nr:GIY-YIG nuclease family protein [Xanthomonadaceae bacterium]